MIDIWDWITIGGEPVYQWDLSLLALRHIWFILASFLDIVRFINTGFNASFTTPISFSINGVTVCVEYLILYGHT